MSDGLFEDAPVVFRYTRAQALEDGVLVDLTEWAKETGFVIPVACTSALWQGHIVPPERTRAGGQSERGRVHDLLWMLFNAIRRGPGGNEVHFKVSFLMSPNRQEVVRLKALCGPGDEGEPTITILYPEED